MQHLAVKATTETITDEGTFVALVASWDRDREGDVIRRGAFARSIREWQSVGKQVPLHMNHRSEEIVGSVDPRSMSETDAGLEVAGEIDLDTAAGRKVWRDVKANRIGFSFGYLVTKSKKRAGGGRELLEVDLFEVSLTPSPMNNRTRVISAKSAEAFDDTEAKLAEMKQILAGIPDRAAFKVASFDA